LVFLTIKGTAMNHRKIAVTLAVTAAFAPIISNASPARAALDACARAFVSSLASPGSAAPTFKVDYRGIQSTGSMLEFYTSKYVFDLHANDPKTGLPLAHASCSTDSRGAVIAFSSLPLETAPAAAALAARL
jgi:hypothetical protein